ncbi:MAG: carboxypeptidase regulatory-like domain-containing protein, partial [Gemmatimonadaceae bacterium]|nr:carboxypeptidase regulatory-like domain-containing protein [Gemmatimonadaceae bacterium]
MIRLVPLACVCILLLFQPAIAHEAGPDEIAGVVTDEAGQPIQGATVDAWSWYSGNETKTDKDGKFHLNKLRDGRPVELKISMPGYSPWYNVAQPLGVSDCNVTLN